jgi:hypothetical protein
MRHIFPLGCAPVASGEARRPTAVTTKVRRFIIQ